MTTPLPPLVTVDDPDYAKFKDGDEEYLLRVASDAIRDYCGWHIAPSITDTYRQLKVGSKGIVPLPSRYVTDVSEVALHDHDPEATPQLVDPLDYEWYQDGWMESRTNYAAGWGWPGLGYRGPDAPYPAVGGAPLLVDVTMTHGYDELPANLKQIAFELAQSTATTSGLISGVKQISSPQYSASFSEEVKAGMTFTPEHLNTLRSYKVGGWFA
jgi:hypothetical protein